MEGITRDSLIDYLTSNELLSGRQRGFVSGRSCVTNLLAFSEDWTPLLDSGSSGDVIYLDFSKAFDFVPHECLKVKLRALGVQGEVLALIVDFFLPTDVNMFVLTDNCLITCV